MLTHPANSLVRAQATVDHIRNRQYRVTVTGLAPHNETRTYTIQGDSDKEVAFLAIEKFTRAMANPLTILHSL